MNPFPSSSSFRGARRIGSPGGSMYSVMCRWTQPQRDMRGLHRLLHHGQQLLAQLVQVHLLPQGGAESGHGLGGVILATIEAPVNDPLDASTERLEQKVRSHGGEDDG